MAVGNFRHRPAAKCNPFNSENYRNASIDHFRYNKIQLGSEVNKGNWTTMFIHLTCLFPLGLAIKLNFNISKEAHRIEHFPYSGYSYSNSRTGLSFLIIENDGQLTLTPREGANYNVFKLKKMLTSTHWIFFLNRESGNRKLMFVIISTIRLENPHW